MPVYPTYQPSISGVTFRQPVVADFRAVGDGPKHGHLHGEYYDKAYWYYNPNVNVAADSGTVVVEITNGNKASFGLETEGASLGAVVNFLDASMGVLAGFDARVMYMNQPAYGLPFDATAPAGFWTTVKKVAVRPYIVDGAIGDNWGIVIKGTF